MLMYLLDLKLEAISSFTNEIYNNLPICQFRRMKNANLYKM